MARQRRWPAGCRFATARLAVGCRSRTSSPIRTPVARHSGAIIVIRLALALLSMMAPPTSAQPVSGAEPRSPRQEIVYTSLDSSNSIAFAEDGVRVGPPMVYWPGDPPAASRYVTREDGVHCVSIGIPGNTTNFAIKRPIKAGERYRCDRSSFRVVRCFQSCRSAIIAYNSRPERIRDPEGYLYVNNCAGVRAISQGHKLKKDLPLDAAVLRGEAGILAHPDFPKCNAF